MRTRQLALEQQATFSLIRAHQYVKHVLKLTGLTDVIPPFADVKSARARLGPDVSSGHQDPTARARADEVDH